MTHTKDKRQSFVSKTILLTKRCLHIHSVKDNEIQELQLHEKKRFLMKGDHLYIKIQTIETHILGRLIIIYCTIKSSQKRPNKPHTLCFNLTT